MEDLIREISLYIKARYPIIYLVTPEENRAERLVKSTADANKKDCFFWSATEGFYNTDKFRGKTDPASALNAILKYTEPGLFVLKDFHAFFEDKFVVRKLRDIVADLRNSYKTVIIISPVLPDLPPGLEKGITPIDIPLPSPADLKATLFRVLRPLVKQKRIVARLDDQLVGKMVNAARGLTETEAENLFSKLIVSSKDKTFDERNLPAIVAEKKKLIRKSGLLEYQDFSEDVSTVGGLNTLKMWLTQRGMAFSQKARDFGLPEPKGIMLLGVPGCGKSLAAKATSVLWNFPLLKLDMGKIFGSYIGSSEKNMREAISVAEALSPDILWVDEIDKGFAGAGSQNAGDSGTSSRVFGTFLTWLQEKTAPVFVLATANNIQNLPPELLRKGRFDEIFFIDLPSPEERRAIFSIHLKKRKRNPDRFNIDLFAERTDGFTGSEIEQLIISGLYHAFGKDRDLVDDDILFEIKESIPSSVTYRESIDEMRAWAKTRARSAS